MLTLHDLKLIEKSQRAAQETMLTKIEAKMVTKDDLKQALKDVVHKKDLRAMENRIIKKINLVSDSEDSRLVDLEERTDRVETQLRLPSISNL